jgi:hypothetical protein
MYLLIGCELSSKLLVYLDEIKGISLYITQWINGGINPCILNFGTRYRWMASFMFQPLLFPVVESVLLTGQTRVSLEAADKSSSPTSQNSEPSSTDRTSLVSVYLHHGTVGLVHKWIDVFCSVCWIVVCIVGSSSSLFCKNFVLVSSRHDRRYMCFNSWTDWYPRQENCSI